MRALRLVLWSGALAVSVYGIAWLCFPDRERTRGANPGKAPSPAAATGRADLPESSFADKVEAVHRLKREGRHPEAIALLLGFLNKAEREAARAGSGIASWYYEQLAILYRKEEQFVEEVKVLKRYLAIVRKLGTPPAKKLENRLTRAKELLVGS
ncbi:MAG: hypothetical protein P8Y63_06155 [Deltaproteobacteria bacterium]|jgi:hypothetical protein